MEAGWEAEQVVRQVARAADRSDIATMMSHFSDDAVLEVGDRTVTGRDAIFTFFGGDKASPGDRERTKHIVTNTVVSGEGDELALTSYWQVLRSWGVANWGRYEDRLARIGGSRKIVNRRVESEGQVARPS